LLIAVTEAKYDISKIFDKEKWKYYTTKNGTKEATYTRVTDFDGN
jgi:hypothetical protein